MNDADAARTSREYELLESCFWLHTRLRVDARRHLQHGFIQRLMMLQAGRLHLLENANPADATPRGPYVATELSLQANAYYLNVRGSLDNLAWCLQYQCLLISRTSETGGHRSSIYLFHPKFLKALEASHAPLAKALCDKREWGEDLRSRRDPAAHRIPLQVPRAVLSEEAADRYQQMDAEAADLIRAGEYDFGRSHLHDSERLGSFQPWLVQSGSRGPVFINLHEQVGRDHDELLAIAETITQHLAKMV